MSNSVAAQSAYAALVIDTTVKVAAQSAYAVMIHDFYVTVAAQSAYAPMLDERLRVIGQAAFVALLPVPVNKRRRQSNIL